MAYSGNPSSSAKDLIRFLLQDTTSTELLTDAEINASYTMQDSSMQRTLEMLTTALIAKFAGKPQEESVESLGITYGDMASKYRALQGDFQRMASNGTLPTYNEVVVAPVSPSIDIVIDTTGNVWSHLC